MILLIQRIANQFQQLKESLVITNFKANTQLFDRLYGEKKCLFKS